MAHELKFVGEPLTVNSRTWRVVDPDSIPAPHPNLTYDDYALWWQGFAQMLPAHWRAHVLSLALSRYPEYAVEHCHNLRNEIRLDLLGMRMQYGIFTAPGLRRAADLIERDILDGTNRFATEMGGDQHV
jgi:hypothetical protein